MKIETHTEILTLAKVITNADGTTIEIGLGAIKWLTDLGNRLDKDEFTPIDYFRQLADIKTRENFREYHRFCEELIYRIRELMEEMP